MENRGAVFLRALVFYDKILVKGFEELSRRHAVEVFDHTVVVDNLEMRSRESHCKEIVIFLVAFV